MHVHKMLLSIVLVRTTLKLNKSKREIVIKFVDFWPKEEIVELYKAGGWWKDSYEKPWFDLKLVLEKLLCHIVFIIWLRLIILTYIM